MTAEIRPATAADAGYVAHGFAALAAHLNATTDNPFVAELPDGAQDSQALARTFVGGAGTDDADAFALVAVEHGSAVGCLAARMAPASVGWSARLVGQIVCCWVEPEARRRGTGRALTRAAEAQLRARGAAYAELAYVVGNAEAEAAWVRLGYAPHRVFALRDLTDR